MQLTYKYGQLNFRVFGRLVRVFLKRKEFSWRPWKYSNYTRELDRFNLHLNVAWWQFYLCFENGKNYSLNKEKQIFEWNPEQSQPGWGND
jgi:hypothetical protein